jgi:hypothetical protein
MRGDRAPGPAFGVLRTYVRSGRLARAALATVGSVVLFASLSALAFAGPPWGSPPGSCVPPGQTPPDNQYGGPGNQYGGSGNGPSGDQYTPPGAGDGPPGQQDGVPGLQYGGPGAQYGCPPGLSPGT